MVTAESLAARAKHVQDLFTSNADRIERLQAKWRETLIPALQEELELDLTALERIERFIGEPSTIWRFLRRARFDTDDAVVGEFVRKAIKWRLEQDLDAQSVLSLDPLYTTTDDDGLPLFVLHPKLKDKLGRPAAILTLRRVQRTEDGSLDALKEFITVSFEATRRYMLDLTEKAPADKPVLQMVLLVDLENARMSNLEMELLPFMLELMRASYPSMVGAIYILHYGWTFAGMWQLAKRLLPRQALDRILFPSLSDLAQFFEPDALLAEHGGTLQYHYRLKTSLLARYGRPTWPGASGTNTPVSGSRTPSRVSSFDSLHDASRGSLSPMNELRPLAPHDVAMRLNRHRGARDRRRYHHDSDDDDDPTRFPHWAHPPHPNDQRSVPPSAAASRDPSPSRRSASGRRRHHPLVRVVLGPVSRTQSRFSASNPAFGYRQLKPEQAVSSADEDGAIVPIIRPRRRWRDLVKTLVYLAALRFLALHRAAERSLAPFFSLLARLGIRRARTRRKRVGQRAHSVPPTPPVRSKRVTWGSEVEEHPPKSRKTLGKSTRRGAQFVIHEDIDDERPLPTVWAYAFVAFLVLRSPQVDRAIRRGLGALR